MILSNVRCLSLGVKESKGGEFNGVTYPPSTKLSFIIEHEDTSKNCKIPDDLKQEAYAICGRWGTFFQLSGEMSAKGYVTKVTAITADASTSTDDDLSFL